MDLQRNTTLCSSSKSNAGWNFEWDFSESCQFTKYKKGQYYDWHCDSWDRPYIRQDNPMIHLMVKLESYL